MDLFCKNSNSVCFHKKKNYEQNRIKLYFLIKVCDYKMNDIKGKTINELTRITDITGDEIIPLAVPNGSKFNTSGITINNLFNIIYNMIQESNIRIDNIKTDVTDLNAYAYVNIAAHNVQLDNLSTDLAYAITVNNLQSSSLNTLYYQNSTDAFNNYDDPDDDNVKPQNG